MKLTIWTHWEGKSWEGEIPDGEVAGSTGVDGTLEYVFRFFNRVEEADGERLDAIGYRLPSLSVGDTVTIDGVRWRCAPFGWSRAEEKGTEFDDRGYSGGPIVTAIAREIEELWGGGDE